MTPQSTDPQDAQEIAAELESQFSENFSEIGTRPEQEQMPKCKVALKITNGYLGRSSGSGRKQLTIVTEVLECSAGEQFVGHTYTKNWGLETSENIQWLNSDLSNLEIAYAKTPQELVALANALTGVCFDGSLNPNADPQFPPNCYINKGARRKDLEGADVKAPASNF